jgi:hypothetical protein
VETTGADANEEFARWLAETAKAGQTADQARSAQPGAPAATPPVAPPGAMPPPPSAPGQPAPPSPEFFGAEQPPSPPTRPYEAPFAGPQIARTSFQPAAGDPPLPPAPAPPPPAGTFAPIVPVPPAPPAPPAASAPPAAGTPLPPAWAPAAPPPPAESTPFFPAGDAAPVGFPPAPPPSAAPPAFPPLETPPAFATEPGPPPPGAPVPPSFPPVPPAAPVPPPAPEPPGAPSYVDPYAQLAPPAAAPTADPYAAPVDATSADTAARLAASPPPGLEAPPTAAPPVGERPADEDALSALFGGLHTAEAPVAPTADLFASAPVAPPPPVYTPEPAFTVEPVPPPIAPIEPEPSRQPVAPASRGSRTVSSPPPPADDPTAGTQFFGGGTGDYEAPPDLDRTTAGEKAAFVLAFLIPPAGLIGSIVAAAHSARNRGWVHGFVRAGLIISIVTTIAAGFGAAFAYKVLEDQRRFDSLAAASTQFCSTIAEQPDMITPPTFGFPGPGASIPETIDGIQAYIDRWVALAAVSPSGIRPDVTRVADAARGILETIETTRLVNNEQNIANMTSVAESTQIVAWEAEYC